MTTRPPDTPVVVLCTCPDPASGEALGRHLVEQNLAACVNILDACRSVYRWQGEVSAENEALLLIKTLDSRVAQLEQVVVACHPYEVPELVVLDVQHAHAAYLDWIRQSVT